MAPGKCCGVVQHTGGAASAQEKNGKRRSGQPWVVLKLMVVMTLGIVGYAAYVYVGRLCVPMIREKGDAGAGRGTGIALLLVFVLLYLWMLWAYIKVVITSPGYAKDYLTISERPLIPAQVPFDESTRKPHTDMELGHHSQQHPLGIERGFAGPSYEDLTRNGSIIGGGDIAKPHLVHDIDIGSNPSNDTQRQSATASISGTHPSNTFRPPSPSTTLGVSPPQDKRLAKAQKAAVQLHRRPPSTPVLQPLHRYCLKDEFVKPYRAHHCRSCGTCVLKYDHHCPWIGQCVGARNHKFFLNFCLAAVFLASFSLATLIAFVVRIHNAGGPMDIEKIVLMALCLIFLLFTMTMVISQANMILSGQTTVEKMKIQAMEMRERKLLGEFYSCWEYRAKAKKLQEWDDEWGALSTEGNIWWRGDRHAEWVDVMGDSWLGWIFPIGRGLNDGLTYPVNPRFDAEGRWRRRADWPEELR